MKELWLERFAGDINFIHFFFEARLKENSALVYREDGLIASFVFLFPARVLVNGSYSDANYIYALATGAQFSGRGFAKKLLEYANALNPTFLVPSNEGLFGFYEKIGYSRAFYKPFRKTDIIEKIAEKPDYISAEEYARIRRERLTCEGFVDWGLEHINFCVEEARRNYGGAVKFRVNGVEHAAIIEGVNKLKITESTLLDENQNPPRQIGMVKGLNVKGGYLGLYMD